MSRPPRWWDQLDPAAILAPVDPASTSSGGSRTTRDWWVDVGAFVIAMVIGALTLRIALQDDANSLTTSKTAIDAAIGLLCCLALWWRRRWPLGVALFCVVVGTLSTFSTVAGMLALASLAVHRPVRPVALVAGLSLPAAVGCAIFLGRADRWSQLLVTVPLVVATCGWGMFIRARRQLLVTLRDRALRAEADQLLHADSARLAERTRIAREMHDVMAHRISLVALHAGALEVTPDLSPERVRESAALLRLTAHQALEELRGVIGVLRAAPGETATSTAPQPSLADIPRLVEETRRAGAKIDFEMQVEHPEAAPGALGRDAYRIVQEALTNLAKHARGTHARVRVTGAPSSGLHVSVRNPLALTPQSEPVLPGAGAGLLGLAERVTLAGGVLVHGPDASGDFVVEADLSW